MNLEEEFKKIGSTVEDVKPVIYDLYHQKEELNKKIHLFNIISFSRAIMELLGGIDIKSHSISAINLRHYRDYESGMNNLMFDLLDLNGQTIEGESMTSEQSDIYCQFMDILSSNGVININGSLINEDFKEDVWQTISLLNNTEKDIFILFLNKELKTIYEYHIMNKDLSNGNVTSRKSKV